MNKWHSAPQIVAHLGGHWRGHSGVCRCPAHEDTSPSLSVSETRDGRVLVHCFAGCGQLEVIGALRAMGLWGGDAEPDPNYPARFISRPDGAASREERKRRELAAELWEAAMPAGGTAVQSYLRHRGVKMPMGAEIRFAAAMKHAPSKQTFPAMIARVSDNRGLCAIQRTWLQPDGQGKAPVSPAKMTLGPMGGGAVRLYPADDRVGLAEGIETAFSATQLYRFPVWACLSANRLAKVDLPATVRMVVIFADNGEVGRREAWDAAKAYERRGLHVEIITPNADFKAGSPGDFNDILLGGQ